MFGDRWEHATVEWQWDNGAIRCDRPRAEPLFEQGEHDQVLARLNALGSEGWEVVSSVAAGNWLFWTLKRKAS